MVVVVIVAGVGTVLFSFWGFLVPVVLISDGGSADGWPAVVVQYVAGLSWALIVPVFLVTIVFLVVLVVLVACIVGVDPAALAPHGKLIHLVVGAACALFVVVYVFQLFHSNVFFQLVL